MKENTDRQSNDEQIVQLKMREQVKRDLNQIRVSFNHGALGLLLNPIYENDVLEELNGELRESTLRVLRLR